MDQSNGEKPTIAELIARHKSLFSDNSKVNDIPPTSPVRRGLIISAAATTLGLINGGIKLKEPEPIVKSELDSEVNQDQLFTERRYQEGFEQILKKYFRKDGNFRLWAALNALAESPDRMIIDTIEDVERESYVFYDNSGDQTPIRKISYLLYETNPNAPNSRSLMWGGVFFDPKYSEVVSEYLRFSLDQEGEITGYNMLDSLKLKIPLDTKNLEQIVDKLINPKFSFGEWKQSFDPLGQRLISVESPEMILFERQGRKVEYKKDLFINDDGLANIDFGPIYDPSKNRTQ